MRHLAHFVCLVFGAGAVVFGIIGIVKGQGQGGVTPLCLGAALFLLARIYDQTEDLKGIAEKLDRLLEASRGGRDGTA